jgi:hypothetical protein
LGWCAVRCMHSGFHSGGTATHDIVGISLGGGTVSVSKC